MYGLIGIAIAVMLAIVANTGVWPSSSSDQDEALDSEEAEDDEDQRPVTVSDETRSGVPADIAGYVTPADIGEQVGARNPKTVIEGDIVMSTDRELLEDIHLKGCVQIEADDVVIRNVHIECGSTYPIKVNGASGTRVESSTIDCLEDPRARKGIFFEFASDFGVDRTEIRGCDDQLFVDGGVGRSFVTRSVFHHLIEAEAAHTDGIQIGEFETTTGQLIVAGNWWEYDREGCCDNAVVFTSSASDLGVEVRYNYLDGRFGSHLIRCTRATTCIVENNVVSTSPAGTVLLGDPTVTAIARCNRFLDGSAIPLSLYIDATVIDDDC